MVTEFTVLESIERQAASCAHIGSPLYAALLTGLAGDLLSGGLTAELLDDVSDRPVHDAVPLRYLATAHRLALAGEAPELAACYPSCGGAWRGDDITDVFLGAVATHRGEFVRGLQRNVQTNEVARAAVLAAGFSCIADRHGLPMRTFELGGSAGLLSHWDRFGFDTGESRTGDEASVLQFGPEWYDTPPPHLHRGISVVDRASVDITPIDVTTDAGRLSMLSFVWPDQLERFERLDRAIGIARTHPLTVDTADAGDWLGERLAAEAPAGVATVVFHSIVWQYLPDRTKDVVRVSLREAGERSDRARPVFWLRMEPATREHADLRLTTWDRGSADGVDELLAHVGYHGAGVRWLG
ncbi:MAG: DUF2332 domain-containing protein [Acidimicrobiales bacterium]